MIEITWEDNTPKLKISKDTILKEKDLIGLIVSLYNGTYAKLLLQYLDAHYDKDDFEDLFTKVNFYRRSSSFLEKDLLDLAKIPISKERRGIDETL